MGVYKDKYILYSLYVEYFGNKYNVEKVINRLQSSFRNPILMKPKITAYAQGLIAEQENKKVPSIDVLNMTLEAFFSKERFIRCGVPIKFTRVPILNFVAQLQGGLGMTVCEFAELANRLNIFENKSRKGKSLSEMLKMH
jgi:hypothetical protein